MVPGQILRRERLCDRDVKEAFHAVELGFLHSLARQMVIAPDAILFGTGFARFSESLRSWSLSNPGALSRRRPLLYPW
jgi:hypothetical protein